jgi:N-acetylneuraminic acid mutarotase
MRIPRTHLVSAAILVLSASGVAWSDDSAGDLARREADRRAIEQVYWSHRIWPAANRGSKPDLAAVLPAEILRERVVDDLRKRAALERVWGRRITADEIQAELNRMAAHSRSPQVLREVFTALGNDPRRIAEALAEPALVDRVLRSVYAGDRRFHEDARRRAERSLVRGATERDLGSLGGEYVEAIYLRRDTSAQAPEDSLTAGVALPPSEWDALLGRLAGAFDAGSEGAAGPESLPLLVTSPLVEEPDAFCVYRVIEAANDRLRLAVVAWPKQAFETWWQDARTHVTPTATPLGGDFSLPEAAGTCADDTWSSMVIYSPSGRVNHTAVWTGSEMIVWGGSSASALNTGARYNPATDLWVPTAVSGSTPEARTGHTAVWTGTEMIVWGGGTFNSIYNALRSGGRYDPQADSWAAVRNDATSPTSRVNHAAVWTGSEMIIWGGGDASCNCGYENTGARYNPVSNTWGPTRADPTAPEGRAVPTAVWTGSEMIVWGGFRKSVCCLAGHTDLESGGRYNPLTDSWTLIAGGGGRSGHVSVWTGSEMIAWGGFYRTWNQVTMQDVSTPLNTGARYNPAANSWTPTAITAATPPAGSGGSAIWTGSRMVVWRGTNGGRYDPAQDTWASVRADLTAPTAAGPAVWTGSEMIVWGGSQGKGGRYDPVQDTWMSTAANSPFPGGIAPQGRAVWTGTEMIISGDPAASGRYNPATDQWSAVTSVGAPQARTSQTSVWTGTEVIVWGGQAGSTKVNSGGAYNPTTNHWIATSLAGAPSARSHQSAVWTGSEMIVWGGFDCCALLGTGGRYNPSTHLWTSVLADGTAPVARYFHTAVWTGNEMIVWGGFNNVLPPYVLNSGSRYDPGTDTWTPTEDGAAGPDARYQHTAVWTGTEMIAWGGLGLPLGSTPLQVAGWAYSPAADTWMRTRDDATVPEGRSGHVATWNGGEMIIWGGTRDGSTAGTLDSGSRYNPAADEWIATSVSTTTPLRRFDAASAWTGSEVLVWGGIGPDGLYLSTGSAYCAPCVASTFYLDDDADGHGDPAQTLDVCSMPAGYAPSGDDCNDTDAGSWGTPSEARDLVFIDQSALEWTLPASPGGALLQYDLVRTGDPGDFLAGASCLASGSPATTATDPETPGSGQAFHYLVRARSGCAAGQSILGTSSDGTPIAGRSCP